MGYLLYSEDIRGRGGRKVTTLEQGLLEEDVNRLCVSIAEQAGVRHQRGNDGIRKIGKETTKPRAQRLGGGQRVFRLALTSFLYW